MSYSRAGEERKMPEKIHMAVLLFGCLFALIVQSLANVCNVDGATRKDCGWHGISAGGCQAKNCCWDDKIPSVPHCFYNSEITKKLKTKTACEHHPPILLQCNSNETISIYDVFYGRNHGNNPCHFSGDTTCFNRHAKDIVRNICRDNSTCSVSPDGSIWNFDPSCDALNAQLVVNYFCTPRAISSSTITVVDTPIPTVSSRATGQTSLSSQYILSTSLLPTSLSEQSSSSADVETSLAATEASSIMSPTSKVAGSSPSVVMTQSSSPGTSGVTASISATALISATTSTAAIVDATSSESTTPSSSTINPGQASQSATSTIVSHTYQGRSTMLVVTPSLSTTITQPNSLTSGVYVLPSTLSTEFATRTTSAMSSKVEPSASQTQLSSVGLASSTMKMASANQLSTMSTYSKQATSSSMPALSTASTIHVSTSRLSTTSSVLTTNPPNETDTNKGNQKKTTYIIVGVCVGALVFIICLFLFVRYVKRRLDPQRHAMLANDVVIASQGTYYGLPMNDLQTGYDNLAKDEEKNGTEAYSNQIYQMKAS